MRRTNGGPVGIALLGCLAAACSSSGADAPAPTYGEIYAKLFAPGTPGHCANAGCHGDPGHDVWLCGTTKDTCYAGMVQVGLVDPAHPQASSMIDPSRSPLAWFNSASGIMPLDAQEPNPAGRDAIAAWIRAGATND